MVAFTRPLIAARGASACVARERMSLVFDKRGSPGRPPSPELRRTRPAEASAKNGRCGSTELAEVRAGRPGFRPLVTALLVVVCGTASLHKAAGEEGPADPDDGGLLKRAAWEWEFTGRRDPFEFRSPKTEEPVEDEVVTRLPVDSGSTKPTRVKPRQPKRNLGREQNKVWALAESAASSAEEHLSLRQHTKAEELAAMALRRMKEINLKDQSLEERLVRLRATARRLAERAEIEREFRNLRISIQGIVWKQGKAVALINGKIKRSGDVVEGARIDDIRPNEVIFVLAKGVRVRKKP